MDLVLSAHMDSRDTHTLADWSTVTGLVWPKLHCGYIGQ